jgi:predicted ATPase
MKIKSLNIKNFKSIVDVTIDEPNPFTVFVGPNGSGKSNIFEALEFSMECYKYPPIEKDFEKIGKLLLPNPLVNFVENLYGGFEKLRNWNSEEIDTIYSILHIDDSDFQVEFQPSNSVMTSGVFYTNYYDISKNFLRLFVNNKEKQKINFSGNSKLSFSADNLEKVLKRLLEDEVKREEITDWLYLFIPEFDRIEVQKSQFRSNEDLLIYQKYYDRPFNKELISDGTYNIIAILTAVFQSDEPQFLCIEEPENGLNPKVVRELVNLFRDACEQYGHYIWINTHSQTFVSKLEEHELIIVDKIKGETKIKQFKKGAFYGMPADEALLTNALGGGNPW